MSIQELIYLQRKLEEAEKRIAVLEEALQKIKSLPKIPTRGGGHYTHESWAIARAALAPSETAGQREGEE